MESFDQLHLIDPILRALAAEGYSVPTPIQSRAIPPLLEGKDVLGSAQTGTGKTAAFAIPILQNLTRDLTREKLPRAIRALVLAPTRELALQNAECFHAYGKNLRLRTTVIFGGVSQKPQEDALKNGVDILVATPGRLLDLFGQKLLSLSSVRYFVLDEADRMLDMGFIHDVRKIIALLPKERQTMLFSATVPPEIESLSQDILIRPERIAVVPVETTLDAIGQELYWVGKKQKTALLLHLLKNPEVESALVFSRTKHGANKIVKDLSLAGIRAEALHGNKSQNARIQALTNFKKKETRVLVATDIAARGLDIERLSHVIQYDLPEVAETYIHRIGRTGRAGLTGSAIAFCSEEEAPLLKDIEKFIRKPIPVVRNHPFASSFPVSPNEKASPLPPPTQISRQADPRGTAVRKPAPKPNPKPTPKPTPKPASAVSPKPAPPKPKEGKKPVQSSRNAARPQPAPTGKTAPSSPKPSPSEPRKFPNPPIPKKGSSDPVPPKKTSPSKAPDSPAGKPVSEKRPIGAVPSAEGVPKPLEGLPYLRPLSQEVTFRKSASDSDPSHKKN